MWRRSELSRFAVLAIAGVVAGCAHTVEKPAPRAPWLSSDAGPDEPRDDTPPTFWDKRSFEDELGGLLDWPVVERRYFVPRRRCEQGPIMIRISWEPSALADYVGFYAYAPRAVDGHMLTKVATHRGGESPFGPDYRPDNAACVAGPADTAPAAAGGVLPAGATGAAPSGEARAPHANAVAPSPPHQLEEVDAAVTPTSPEAFPREIPAPPERPFGRRMQEFGGYWPTGDPATGAKREPSANELTVIIWFEQPNDLEGVTFVFVHRAGEPRVPKAEILARFRDIADKKEADRQKAIHHWDDRDRFCDAHHEDTACWGEGGYAGAAAREAEARKHPVPPPTTTPPPPRDYTMSPPPAPLPETKPPTPSVHADWVPGYWHWLEGRWNWIGGRWRVPPDDVRQALTVHAPAAPPAPRPESPPPTTLAPGPRTLVWAPGFWQWDGYRFVWVGGAWQLAPAPGAIWTADRWELRDGAYLFVPGGWVRIGQRP